MASGNSKYGKHGIPAGKDASRKQGASLGRHGRQNGQRDAAANSLTQRKDINAGSSSQRVPQTQRTKASQVKQPDRTQRIQQNTSPARQQRPIPKRTVPRRDQQPTQRSSNANRGSRPVSNYPRRGEVAVAQNGNFNWYDKQKPKSRIPKPLKVILIILLVALLAIAGVCIYYANSLDRALDRGETISASDALTPAAFNEPFYMLLLGSDARTDSDQGAQQTDVMMLTRIDPQKRTITLVSIPRDTPYTLPDGTTIKINAACNYGGPAGAIKAVSQLTGVPISHYAEVHYSEFQEIVDELGGVEYDVPFELSYHDPLTQEHVTLDPGKQVLDGKHAQLLMSARHEYEGNQDAGRQQTIRNFVGAIIKTLSKQPLDQMQDSIVSIADNVSTDLRSIDLLGLAASYGLGSGNVTMYECSGPSDGAQDPARNSIWYCYDNPEGWARLMAVVDSGGDPSGIDVSDTAIIH